MTVRTAFAAAKPRRLIILAAALLAAVPLSACSMTPGAPRDPQAHNVSASVYGRSVESVTTDVYSLGTRHRW